MFMNGHQTWYTNHFFKIAKLRQVMLAKLNKCNLHDECFKLVPSGYYLLLPILSLKINNVLSGEYTKVKKRLFWHNKTNDYTN